MLGYLNAPSPFTEDGYFITGDKVLQNGEYIKILGRESEIINVGGGKKNSVSLSQLTNYCSTLTRHKIKIGSVKKTSPYDVPYYVSNISYVKKLYKWKPKRDLRKILTDLYFWMKPNISTLKKYF